MHKLKLTTVGSCTSIVIPQEMLSHLKVEKGGSLFAIETPNGYLLTPYDSEIEKQLEAGRTFMKQYQETFKTLAE
ncbi:AbrB/MazE/SpoVT family DNA-binding domain-containing protein (plasmid) [Cyanobacterium sp. IPPAS B-1200]|uniref:AbrB/MazE/SpoVT family DNA-binding domain-containing protein n=1 Tax=Cyanobacterium sp. IPPAS B-1200 TaxID=1562720 RepID=UPI0008526AD9|nr:AbrB/MazE/SpoVT family DNA-binding domain-containing protein [Cyanobacterium sp. IPPAS B-1200]OEJ79986.1 transcriptional regulator [Cyanobacterium sp. IPPAS B-1200]